MTTQTADWVGLTLDGRYAVAAKLGEGGMGFVYRAKDARLNCDVVVKAPRAAMLEDAGFRERFRAEVGALVRLAHPHVVKVSDFGQYQGVPFAVMQFLPGGSLEDRRPKDADGHFRAVATRSLTEWLLPVAEALDFIHKQGYVHRDVKPANILFDGHKNAYISDFGVAKAVAGNKAAGPGITGAGMVLGTPTYMAPELVRGETFDGRIDQYALAVTVFELLAGRPPFDGPTPMAVLVQRTIEDAPALLDFARDPRSARWAGISAAVSKALSRDPNARYATCVEFAKAVLDAVARGGAATGPPPKPTTANHGADAPKRETPRGGIKTSTAAFGVVGPTVRPPWQRGSANEEKLPLAAVVDDSELKFRSSPPIVPPKSAARTGLIAAAVGGGVLLAVGLGVLLATRGGGAANQGASGSTPGQIAKANIAGSDGKNSEPIESVSRRPQEIGESARPDVGLPIVTALRVEPTSIELVAGGAWAPIDVVVERTGTGPVTVEMNTPPSSRVDVRPASVVVDASGTAHFELRANAAARPAPRMAAHVSVSGSSHFKNISITVKRLSFAVSVDAAGDISMGPGDEKPIELRIDRSGGYAGELTVNVPASAVLKPTTVKASADAATVSVTLSAAANIRPGTYPIHIAVAAADGSANQTVSLTIRVSPAVEVRSFVAHSGKVKCVSFSPDSRFVISGGADGTVCVWDVATGEQKWKVDAHPGGVLSVAFSADGQRAISGGADHGVRLYEVASGKDTACDKIHAEEVWLVRFAEGMPTSTSGDKVVRWEADGRARMRVTRDAITKVVTKRVPDTLPGHRLVGTTRVPTEDGEHLLAGLGTPSATLFKRGPTPTAPAKTTSKVPAHAGITIRLMAAAGSGQRVVTIGDDNAVRLWETTTPTARLVPGFPWALGAEATCVGLDGSGHQALLGGPDGALKLWRLP